MKLSPLQKTSISYLQDQIISCRIHGGDWLREFEARLHCLRLDMEYIDYDGHIFVGKDSLGREPVFPEWPEYMSSIDDSLVFAEFWAQGTITRLNYTLVQANPNDVTAGWAALWTPNDLSGARGHGAWSYDKKKGDDAFPPTRPIAIISAALNGIYRV